MVDLVHVQGDKVTGTPTVAGGLRGLGSVFGPLLNRALRGEDLSFLNSGSLNGSFGGTVANQPQPSSLIDVNLTGSANLALPISAPFLAISPGPDTTLGINWTDISDPSTISIQMPSGQGDMANFNNMDADKFVSLLGHGLVERFQG